MVNLRPFKKLLIANRGEIAVRIMRACRDLGIRTVAVYSDADRMAPHVRYADEAYHIGKAPASESYLVIPKLLDVMQKSGAEAIHPGYGFLAERADFAQMVTDEGYVWVGPAPHSIRVMGDKLTARETAKAAGVPIVPGTEPGLDDAAMIAVADQIGYPLLVKASAGGGGKGMRPVHDPAELAGAIASARREAESAFGDGTVYLERMIMDGRHIEIQVLADGHGNVIHLGERECSLQRRHQKLIEEAPSIAVDETIRAQMGEVGCNAARSVDYVGVGTIEFLMDSDSNYYFLEMNTRLQVEHPVTELVTGVDLVKEQLRVAQGYPLKIKQEQIVMNGWAMECRINAEDPFSNFMPSTGMLKHIQSPKGAGVRVDTGVCAGYEITPYYDSMISKLICHGSTREEARLRMLRALDEYQITGVITNIPFHRTMLKDQRFIDGAFDTNFVEKRFSMDDYAPELMMEAAVSAVLAHHLQQSSSNQPTAQKKNKWKWGDRA